MADPVLRVTAYIACLLATFAAGWWARGGSLEVELQRLREQIDRLAAMERAQRRATRELLARVRALPQHAHGPQEGEEGGQGG